MYAKEVSFMFHAMLSINFRTQNDHIDWKNNKSNWVVSFTSSYYSSSFPRW